MVERGPFHENFFAAHMHDQETTAAAKGVNIVLNAYMTIWADEVSHPKQLPEELQRDVKRMELKVRARP